MRNRTVKPSERERLVRVNEPIQFTNGESAQWENPLTAGFRAERRAYLECSLRSRTPSPPPRHVFYSAAGAAGTRGLGAREGAVAGAPQARLGERRKAPRAARSHRG